MTTQPRSHRATARSTPRGANDRVRQALLAASELEAAERPFQLSGRGHEPRVTLDVRLAQVVRSLGLPRVEISGFGANKHYPERVFARAAADLRRQLGWSPIELSFGKAWLQDQPPAGTTASAERP